MLEIYCPVVGGKCNKSVRVKRDVFFLAEPFDSDRGRREKAVRNAIKNALGKDYSENCLIVGDNDPKHPSWFCDICRMIQSSAYGIVDISDLNPNVLIEFGMMIGLGKPVFVLVKKSEEKKIKDLLPSDIIWMRVVPYEEFIDIEDVLAQLIKNRPEIEEERTPIDVVGEVARRINPALAKELEKFKEEIKRDYEKKINRLEELLKDSGFDTAEKKNEIPSHIEEHVRSIIKEVEGSERALGFPDDVELAYLRAVYYYRKGEYEKAMTLCNWALAVDPTYADAWNGKGAVLYKFGKYYEAIECFTKALKINPKFVNAWNNKGNALCRLGKYRDAIKCYNKALEIDPEYMEAIMNLSEIFIILDKLNDALVLAEMAFKKANSIEERIISRFLIISAYIFKGELDKADKEMIELAKELNGFKVRRWDFSPMMPAIEKIEDEEAREKLLSLISLLRGE
ncbi:tetratricopeptide repeat protein [Archaeoglobus veneficus]|uniref:Tetratricopeptide TPR_1 repeat-containing protein n=1 Tax=Archaeoglobus veneficus (strain DSM 11195 / SNP6) TaxID=693661 RepID=F2KPR1_ARCVS|nr:tetratricopeptide repeat protein [Archaeoglobus veneficus]AEA47589.1 Tetratricopeptide TPR_1 repeat-containing protein [Archaeoglobus veneficus SNP6]